MAQRPCNCLHEPGQCKQSAPGFGPGAAIADYDAAVTLMVALREGLGKDWSMQWRKDLASAYMKSGHCQAGHSRLRSARQSSTTTRRSR